VSALSFVTDPAGRYIHWGVILISMTNLLIIVAMVIVFVLALVVPFGSGEKSNDDQERRQP
jgi:cbb3-type cytochrome oxidase subunit 3